jgi:hypothetical protein
MKLEPFDAYRYYIALKMHFESDTYDAVKYNYKTSVTQKSFWKRKDKYHFAKIASKFKEPNDMINYYVSQFIIERKWVGDMLSDNNDSYNQWLKRMQSLTYTFEQDMNTLHDECSQEFDKLFSIGDSPYPNVIYYYMQDVISIETVVILNTLTSFIKRAKINDTIVWPGVSKRIQKYSAFVNPDLKKMREIVLRVFTL